MTAIRYDGDPVTVATEYGTGFVMTSGDHDITNPELLSNALKIKGVTLPPAPEAKAPAKKRAPAKRKAPAKKAAAEEKADDPFKGE